MILTMQHLYFMLRIRTDQMASKKVHFANLASRKTSLFLALRDKDLVSYDDEGHIYITEKGDKLLDSTVEAFNAMSCLGTPLRSTS